MRHDSWNSMIAGLQAFCEHPPYKLTDSKVKEVVDKAESMYFQVMNNDIAVGHRFNILSIDTEPKGSGITVIITRLEECFELISYVW